MPEASGSAHRAGRPGGSALGLADADEGDEVRAGSPEIGMATMRDQRGRRMDLSEVHECLRCIVWYSLCHPILSHTDLRRATRIRIA
jgi:hypothetical protein